MARCALCNDQERRDEVDARLAFDFTPHELLRSAFEQRCSSCIVILEGFRQSETESWSFQHDVRRVYARCCGKRNYHSDSLLLEVYFTDDRPKLELEFYSLQPHAWKAILPRPSISGHPLSMQAMSWVQSLMDTCTKTHESCKSNDKPLLPKRVLKIQDLGNSKFHVRLIETNQEYAIYTALSHCWGTEQPCTTTSSTLKARKQRISWSEIPKTFRDAITFTAKLDVRYIWIDSLCIVQDDAMDWEIESSKMADVYQHAAVTLSATSSPGDTQGCFRENSTFMKDLEINLPEDIGACQIAVRKPLKHWNDLIPSKLLQHFPLLSRGWAFQERILAPRVLHFCESELVWECRQTSTCECGGLGEDISPGGTYYNAIQDSEEEQQEKAAATNELLDQLMAAQLQQEEGWIPTLHERANTASTNSINELSLPPPYIEDPESSDSDSEVIAPPTRIPTYDSILSLDEPEECPDIVRHFHRIVEQYSALRLTKPTDRLPALSGLCKRIQHLRGDYLAGLWSDSLSYDLLWRVNTLDLSSSNSGRPTAYRGPSWSWVTSQSPVSYWDDIVNFKSGGIPGMLQISSPSPGPIWMSREQLDALDPDQMLNFINPNPSESLGEHPDRASAVVEVTGHNPFGQIKSGVLTVEASATTATLLYTYDSYWHGQTNKHDPARYKLSVPTRAKKAEYAAPNDSDVEVPFFADYALGIDGPHMIPTGTLLTLLLVHPKIALVLKPRVEEGTTVMVNGEQAWERIGIARISEALGNYYRVDWMRASEVQKFKIV